MKQPCSITVNYNWAREIKNGEVMLSIVRIFFLISCLLCMVSCSSSKYRCWDIEAYNGNMAIYPDPNIEIIASLNDSIYSYSLVNNELDSLKQFTDEWFGNTKIFENAFTIPSCRVPLLSYYIVNKTSDTLFLPDSIINSYSLTGISPGHGLTACIKSLNGNIEKYRTFGVMFVEYEEYTKEKYHILLPNDTLRPEGSLNILPSESIISIEPGLYNIQVKFRNSLFCETKNNVWYGTVFSDTLWFRVVE